MATICFAVVALFATAYALRIAYYGIIYLALGCCPLFNQFTKNCKQFIDNEWKDEYV